MIGDICPGSMGSSIDHITVVGRLVFFSASDGTHGMELWVSDGTVSGTRLVKDIRPGSGSSSPLSTSHRCRAREESYAEMIR